MSRSLIEPIVGGETPTHLIIAVDFDGTICQHPGRDFPAIGEPVPHALEVLHRLREAGHKLMLWTLRDGEPLNMAAKYLTDNGICCWGWNENPEQNWSRSHKQYAHVCIDDISIGCPMIHHGHKRSYVDWWAVEQYLIEMEVLSDPLLEEDAFVTMQPVRRRGLMAIGNAGQTV